MSTATNKSLAALHARHNRDIRVRAVSARIVDELLAIEGDDAHARRILLLAKYLRAAMEGAADGAALAFAGQAIDEGVP